MTLHVTPPACANGTPYAPAERQEPAERDGPAAIHVHQPACRNEPIPAQVLPPSEEPDE